MNMNEMHVLGVQRNMDLVDDCKIIPGGNKKGHLFGRSLRPGYKGNNTG